MNHETAKEAEILAKRLAKQAGQPEGMFELFLPMAYRELTTGPLTLEKLEAIEPGTMFATGFAMDNSDGLNMAATGKKLKWCAVKGHGHHDWAIYCHFAQMDDDYVRRSGDKVNSEINIRRLVPCDDEALALYRR